MKKSAVFLILSFILLGFFACQFAIPTAIEIIGTPSAKFAETVDVGKMFEDLLQSAIDKDERLTMIPCTNEKINIITNLIYVKLIEDKYDDLMDRNDIKKIFPDTTLIPEEHIGIDIPPVPLENPETLILLNSETDLKNRLIIPLSELGSLLPGFKFYDGKDGNDEEGSYKVRLYFSGSEIIEKTNMNITIFEVKKEDDGETYTVLPGTIPTKCDDIEFKNDKSDIEIWEKDEEYKGVSFVTDGTEIDIPLTNHDIAISFEVFIPKGETLLLSDFKASKIKIELVIWLPLKFEAIKDEASLYFPDDYFFSSEEDLFGRDEPDSESLVFDIVESLSVDINFQKHPFKGRDLIITSKGVVITHRIEEDNALSFFVAEDNMNEINKPENWPFAPDIAIRFTKGATLSFTTDFKAVEFAFKPKVRYRINL
jgi:hypothetical protein